MNKQMQIVINNQPINYLNDFDYVGIDWAKEGEITISFPIGYRIPTDIKDFKNSVLELIEAINIAKLVDSKETFGFTYGNNKEMPLNSYIWLIKDYLTNGLYYDNEKKYKQKINGKINWKRTLKTKYYISDNNVVYLNPVKEKSFKEKNIITEIEIFCLQECQKISWLFGDVDLPRVLTNENNKEYYIQVLEKELLTTFSDHKKLLINHLLRILKETTAKDVDNLKKYGTTNFNYVWEQMVTQIYGNIKSDDFFPRAKYYLLDKKEFETPETFPDTILNYKGSLYILDSKYYRYGVTKQNNNLPSTASIEKQIMYGNYANRKKNKTKYNYQNVYNAFILPTNNSEEKIKYIGYAQSGSHNSKDKEPYKKIAIVLIDTKYLMNCYFNKEIINIEELVKAIDKTEQLTVSVCQEKRNEK